jgi:hypothetical protein
MSKSGILLSPGQLSTSKLKLNNSKTKRETPANPMANGTQHPAPSAAIRGVKKHHADVFAKSPCRKRFTKSTQKLMSV